MKKFVFLLAALIAGFSHPLYAAELKASLNQNQIVQGEAVTLTLSYDGAQTNEQPNFAPLDKDFNIFSVSNAYQHNYINGKISQKREWKVQLMPKASGNITIPALALGSLKSQPLSLEVLPASPENIKKQNEQNAQAANAPRYAVEAEIDTKTPYVQQEVNLTLKIYDTGGLQIERIVPLVNDENSWVIQSLGEPELETVKIGGQDVRVINIKMALFPQKSGELDVPEIAVEGYYLSQSNNDPMQKIFDSFGAFRISALDPDLADIFATKNVVSLRTDPMKISVKPVPAIAQGGWWVPAESLELYSEWKPNPPKFKVGEAITRNIYIKAVGVMDTQLPNINFTDSGALKQYPEKPLSEVKIENGKIVSYRLISNVYIPSKSGNVTIPEVSVKWFNVKTQQLETSSLPAMSVSVEANPSALPQEEEIVEKPRISAPTTAAVNDTPAKNASVANEQPDWRVAALTAFGAGLFLGVLIFAFFRAKKNYQQSGESLKNFDKAVIKYAKEKDLKNLRDSLIAWAKETYPNAEISNLNDVAANFADMVFKAELDKLSSCLYGKENLIWDNSGFLSAFENIHKKKPHSSHKGEKPLPELYKK